jgi:hypothetical protein
MKAVNRLMSIRKWKRVRTYVEAGQYKRAANLAQSSNLCGHCHEYYNDEDECTKCPLYDKVDDGCHADVCHALASIDILALKIGTKEYVLEAIGRVQRLVATK